MRLNHFVNQFSLGESRCVLDLSYGTVLLPEKPRDERENIKEEVIPEMNWEKLSKPSKAFTITKEICLEEEQHYPYSSKIVFFKSKKSNPNFYRVL